MNTQKFKNNGHNKFPISTDTMDFMQEQIKLLYGLASLVGVNIIMKQSSSSEDGLIVVDGELMPLKGSPSTYINVIENRSSVTFNEETIENARIDRYAIYTIATGRPASIFTVSKSLKTLNDELTAAKQHHTPKGTIIDWYGEASCENIPYGWVPCGGFFKTAGGQYQGQGSIPAAITTEKNKWLARYPNATVNVEFHYGPSNSYIRITNIPGFGNIPNLSRRFIVGAGYNSGFAYAYDFQETGGADSVTLTAAESGLPAHNHGSGTFHAVNSQGSSATGICSIAAKGSSYVASGGSDDWYHKIKVETANNENRNASHSHENRPPYYALYKLIKVI